MEALTWTPEKRKVSDLIELPNNPRRIKTEAFEKLKKRIAARGFHDIVKVDHEGYILSGNQRRRALIDLGITTVYALVPSRPLTKEERDKVVLESNRNDGEWDYDILGNEFDLQDLLDVGFEEKDLDIDLSDPKDDEIPETPEEPRSKLGDLYILGNHRVLCGDSTKLEDVERLMDGKKCSVTFTSPPYNAGKSETLSGNTHTTDNKYGEYNDNKSQEEWKKLILDTLSLAMTVSQYQIYNIQMLAGNKKQLLLLLAEYVDHIADIAVWNKGHGAPAMAKNVMNSAYEWIIFFSSNPNATRAIKTGDFRGQMKNIFDIPPQRKNEFANVHAATMPVALPLEVLKYVTKRNDVVYDNFAGTGTTLIAAEKTGRICYGMEIDPKYVDVVVKRWEDFTGQKAKLIRE